jgi:hypothetical protein
MLGCDRGKVHTVLYTGLGNTAAHTYTIDVCSVSVTARRYGTGTERPLKHPSEGKSHLAGSFSSSQPGGLPCSVSWYLLPLSCSLVVV